MLFYIFFVITIFAQGAGDAFNDACTAIREGDIGILEFLLSSSPSLKTEKNSKGKTLIDIAVEEKKYNVALFLMQYGVVDANKSVNKLKLAFSDNKQLKDFIPLFADTYAIRGFKCTGYSCTKKDKFLKDLTNIRDTLDVISEDSNTKNPDIIIELCKYNKKYAVAVLYGKGVDYSGPSCEYSDSYTQDPDNGELVLELLDNAVGISAYRIVSLVINYEYDDFFYDQSFNFNATEACKRLAGEMSSYYNGSNTYSFRIFREHYMWPAGREVKVLRYYCNGDNLVLAKNDVIMVSSLEASSDNVSSKLVYREWVKGLMNQYIEYKGKTTIFKVRKHFIGFGARKFKDLIIRDYNKAPSQYGAYIEEYNGDIYLKFSISNPLLRAEPENFIGDIFGELNDRIDNIFKNNADKIYEIVVEIHNNIYDENIHVGLIGQN